MTTEVFTIERLKALVASGARPVAYLDDCDACDVDDDPLTVTFDTDSDCYRALVAKYRGTTSAKTATPTTSATPTPVARKKGCGCGRAKRAAGRK